MAIGMVIGMKIQKRRDSVYITDLHNFAIEFKHQRDDLLSGMGD
jgi:hypothetical protein